MRKNSIDLNFLYVLIPMLILELLFHYVEFHEFNFYSLFRTYLFIYIFSVILSFITSRFKAKNRFIINLVFIILICFYSFAQLIFKNYMVDFYSFNTVSDGAMRIAQYVQIFLSSARPSYYLCFVPIAVYILMNTFRLIQDNGGYLYHFFVSIISIFMLIFVFDLDSTFTQLSNIYKYYSNKTMIVDKLGITHFLFRDLMSFVYTPEEEIVIVEETEQQEVIEEDIKRTVDDTLWNDLKQNEENSNMLKIDEYLMSRSITDFNEYTGKYEGYNFIYFMVEAFDYLAIDPELTPTLYKMYSEGNTFYNHYSPLYSCATGESEFVSYTSLFPYLNFCTPNYVADQHFYEALPFLFKDKGYSTFALHNWRDQFYERNQLLINLGFDNYTDIDDIWQDKSIPHTSGWQSDAMLIEQAIKQIDETEGNFFCDIITSVMHFPYNESSYWGDYYLKEVRNIHPDWPIDYQRYMSKSMDFDNGLEILLDYLKENNLSDNTIICIYADHRPYWLNYDTVISYTSSLNDRTTDYGIYRSPFIIYEPDKIGEVNYNYCSTLDHVPTIANLFNLNYDPRLYMGKDIYSGNQTVIFADGNWLNKDGIYYAASDSFSSFDDKKTETRTINSTNLNVNNIIKISAMIFDEKYFDKRAAICLTK